MKLYLMLMAALLLFSGSAPAAARGGAGGPAEADTSLIKELTVLPSLPPEPDQLTVIPGRGLFVNVGDGEYMALDRGRCPDFGQFMVTENLWYDQLLACDGRFLVRSGTDVYAVDSAGCTPVARFDTPCFRLFAAGDSAFHAVVYADEGSVLYSCRPAAAELTLELRLPDDILQVEATAGGYAFITPHALYFADGRELHRLFDTEEPLTAVAAVGAGLLFSTAGALYLYDGEETLPLMSGPFVDLFYDDGRTYMVFADGRICYSDIF